MRFGLWDHPLNPNPVVMAQGLQPLAPSPAGFSREQLGLGPVGPQLAGGTGEFAFLAWIFFKPGVYFPCYI